MVEFFTKPTPIPADAAAVRRALASPSNRSSRPGKLFGLCVLFGLLATFWLPRQVQQPTVERISFSQSIHHERGLHLVVPLAREPDRDRTIELDGILEFSFAAADDDFVDSRLAIHKNWDRAGEAARRILQGCTRLDLIHALPDLDARLVDELSTELFPDQRGRVTDVNWRNLRIR